MHAAQPVPSADSKCPAARLPRAHAASLLLWLCLPAQVYQFVSHSGSVHLPFP